MKHVNWIDHLISLVVVILGISIAFYLEGNRDEANLQKREIQYVRSLLADLQEDKALMDTLLIINDGFAKSLIDLSNASVGTQLYASDTLLTNDMLGIQYNPPFTPQLTTYESIKASGNVDVISDFEIRKQIVELYEKYYYGTKTYDEAINQHLRDFIKPFFIHEVTFKSQQSINSAFLNDASFRNMIFAFRYLFLSKNEFYENVSKQIESVQKSLEEYLKEIEA